MSKRVNTKAELLNPKPGMIGRWKFHGERKYYTRTVTEVNDRSVHVKTSTGYHVILSHNVWRIEINEASNRNK